MGRSAQNNYYDQSWRSNPDNYSRSDYNNSYNNGGNTRSSYNNSWGNSRSSFDSFGSGSRGGFSGTAVVVATIRWRGGKATGTGLDTRRDLFLRAGEVG
jgi:hypothetical protein